MTRTGDRIFGVAVILGALAFGASALSLPEPFFSDPLGPKAFPLMVAGVSFLCGAVMALRPDPDPDWPGLGTLGSLALAAAVLVAYAYALKPLGFLVPTAIAAGILSYQIEPRPIGAVLAGLGLSAGLFVLFRYVLGLGLVPFPNL
ncbi:tripartite tricarboxylate transporter TctB family protein [Jannaschia sp. W003]|uniref:tripartite tricarboxylate transporter TctB family protein n=1 Tax=Jannaschia sp. W003 TaxID=2867012 RepID=UPI0021A809D0|nr:tripartite tricarboxylate transporter TctB family protein [Jannaschia sp. W003]UWQ21130.1 tripartite tricarboxylate transporter TctB family protein [Jannaschia sp. W003]